MTHLDLLQCRSLDSHRQEWKSTIKFMAVFIGCHKTQVRPRERIKYGQVKETASTSFPYHVLTGTRKPDLQVIEADEGPLHFRPTRHVVRGTAWTCTITPNTTYESHSASRATCIRTLTIHSDKFLALDWHSWPQAPMSFLDRVHHTANTLELCGTPWLNQTSARSAG